MPADRTRRTTTSREAAEAAFKAATMKPAELPPKRRTIPNAKEPVSLRIDRDILDHFQNAGPGWQDRINEALRDEAAPARLCRTNRTTFACSELLTHHLPLAANFAVMHNAAFLIRTKASFLTPSTAKSLPSGSSKWRMMARAIPMKRVRERCARSASSNRRIAEFLYCSWF